VSTTPGILFKMACTLNAVSVTICVSRP